MIAAGEGALGEIHQSLTNTVEEMKAETAGEGEDVGEFINIVSGAAVEAAGSLKEAQEGLGG